MTAPYWKRPTRYAPEVLYVTSATGKSDPLAANAAKMIAVYKPDQLTSFSLDWEGTVDGVAFTKIGNSISAAGVATDANPWPYTRINVTAIVSNAKNVNTSAKTISALSQAAGVATATSTAHGFLVGDAVTIAGADQTEYNGAQTILTKDDDHFTFAVDEAAVSPATTGSSITATKALLTQSAGVATFKSTAHGLDVGDYVTIAGAGVAGWNITAQIASVPDVDTFTYACAATLPANAAGSVTAKPCVLVLLSS